MDIRSATQSKTRVLARVAVACAIGALAACSAPTPSVNAGHGSFDTGADAVASIGGPAATDTEFQVSAVPTGIVTTRKVCDLLTRADAEAAIGHSLPKNSVNIALGMCDYDAPDYSAGASLTVGTWLSIKSAATNSAHQPQSVDGVGDEALNLGANLYVRKGDEGFLIVLNGPNIDSLPDHGLAIEKALAQKILGRF